MSDLNQSKVRIEITVHLTELSSFIQKFILFKKSEGSSQQIKQVKSCEV